MVNFWPLKVKFWYHLTTSHLDWNSRNNMVVKNCRKKLVSIFENFFPENFQFFFSLFLWFLPIFGRFHSSYGDLSNRYGFLRFYLYQNQSQKVVTSLTHERRRWPKVAIFDFLTFLDSNQPISLDTVDFVKNEVDIRNQHKKIHLSANFEPIRWRSPKWPDFCRNLGEFWRKNSNSTESAQNL